MPPANTQISCPNCRQPVVVQVEQLFDLNEDPTSKERLLSGAVNRIQCPHCGYQGQMSTAVTYHDPDKELLYTFVPAELGLPRNEQEKLVGTMINRVVEALPQEKRKAYLFSPKTMLTYQGMIEQILEADGITKEMIDSQQNKLSLLQRLITISDESLPQVAEEEDELLDSEFFGLLSRLIESSIAAGDQASASQFSSLQEKLLPVTTFGRQVQEQIGEMEAAVKSLQDAGEGLTREKLLEIVLEAPNDTRVSALVNLARQGMDYQFFQSLSDRIDVSEGEEQARLTKLREFLLELTQEVDQQLEARMAQASQLLTAILQSHNIEEATAQNIQAIDQFFVDVLNAELAAARQSGDLEKSGKLQQVFAVLERASSPPPEIAFIQDLLSEPDEGVREQLLQDRAGEVTPELLDTVTAVLNQAQAGDDENLVEAMRSIHRQVLRISMQANIQNS